MIKIEIDGKEMDVEQGTMIIEAADSVSIPIPRFCYHKKLSIAANCRMCLVEVENSPKPVPACATPVTDGMKIWTSSEKAKSSQQAIMEFLLINHPLDCPICDQGGECELQDVSLEYGKDSSRFIEDKRVVEDKNLGPLIATDLTRCIHCTRCVRFGTEIAGYRELGMTGRGENAKIGTFIEQNVDSEVSGNVIDLCPVGALTSKPFRFRARAWEMHQHPAIATHDCIGANVNLHIKNNTIMRVAPRESEKINEIWISDRDRFSYEGLVHEDRIRKPMLRKGDSLNISSWEEALDQSVSSIKKIIEQHGKDNIGCLVSPNCSLEEMYLAQHMLRILGINNIDHRLRAQDFSGQEHAKTMPTFDFLLEDLENQDLIVIVGSNIQKEVPNLGLKIRKATTNDGKVIAINAIDYKYDFSISKKIFTEDLSFLDVLDNKELISSLQNSKNAIIIAGYDILMHPNADSIYSRLQDLATSTKSGLGCITDGSNSCGAWLTGCVPHRQIGGKQSESPGLDAFSMLSKSLKGYILIGVEPEYDSCLGNTALKTLQSADFVLVLSAYQNSNMQEYASVVLPITTPTETNGTRINCTGEWQSYTTKLNPYAESKPAWKVIRVLANKLELPGFEYITSEQVLTEIELLTENTVDHAIKTTRTNKNAKLDLSKLIRIAPTSLYATDYIVRRASSLQQTNDAHAFPKIEINQSTMLQHKLSAKDTVCVRTKFGIARLEVVSNNALPNNVVQIYQSNVFTNSLGPGYISVEITE